jgi:hypothetical protein
MGLPKTRDPISGNVHIRSNASPYRGAIRSSPTMLIGET